MISIRNTQMVEYVGLSTDTKPTDEVYNGSSFYEMDTGATYYFDADAEEGSEWVSSTAGSES